MMERYCCYNSNMYVVDHVIRKDGTIPFEPFEYRGLCEVYMHLQGKNKIAMYKIVDPMIMTKDIATARYPEFFI